MNWKVGALTLLLGLSCLAVFNNCSGTDELSADLNFASGCQRYIDPISCPLEGTTSIEGACPNQVCNDFQISRYRALVMAYRKRGGNVCVSTVNYFAADSGCTGGTGDDPRLCTPNPGSNPAVNARDCIDGAAAPPAITLGTGAGTFGHVPVKHDQAITFAVRALIESKCGNGIYQQLAALSPATQAAYMTQMGGLNSVLWPYVYIVFKLGLVNSSTAAQSAVASVSSAQMQILLNETANQLTAFGCGGLQTQVLM